MSERSLTNKIVNRMNETVNGTIYSNSDFYDLGSNDAVRKALSRLCEEERIYRLMDGYYTIPYYIDIVQEYSYPSADELARKIAKRYAWVITPYGETALNQIGLSTQVPTICEYVSDGPYREYVYFDTIIRFKHTSNRYISKYSEPVSLMVQGIKAIGKERFTKQHLYILNEFAKRNIHEDMLKETKNVPTWIYKIIKDIVRAEEI